MNIVSIDGPTYYAFEPEQYNEYTFGVEKLKYILPAIKRNIEKHWQETEVLYRQKNSDPNYASYMALEDEGKVVFYTVRHNVNKELVGHIVFYIYESMHSIGVMEAREDAFFLQKAHRGGKLASKLYDYAESTFKELGVSQISMTSKAPAGGPNIDTFLRRKGFKPVATSYFKTLEG